VLSPEEVARLLEAAPAHALWGDLEFRSIPGGFLAQTPDRAGMDPKVAKVVSKRQPTDAEWEQLAIAWKVVKHVKSNAIVLVLDSAAVGVGAGQMSRVESVQIAVQYAGPGKTREQHEFQYDVTARDLVSGIAATKGIGYVTPAQWQAQLDLLADLKVITSKPKVEDVLDTSFLDKVLKDGKVVWPG